MRQQPIAERISYLVATLPDCYYAKIKIVLFQLQLLFINKMFPCCATKPRLRTKTIIIK